MNAYSSIENEGNLYPTAPYELHKFPAFGQPLTDRSAIFSQNGNYITGDFVGAAAKAIQPQQQLMGLPHAWSKGYTGEGVKVCVIDGGWDGSIPHDGIELAGAYHGPGGNYYTDVAHALQMLSIVGSKAEASAGIIGNAYGAQIYSAPIQDGGIFYLSESLQWGLAQGCSVFSVSYNIGTVIDIPSVREAVKATIKAKAVVCFAAGNAATIAQMQPVGGEWGLVCVAGLVGGGAYTLENNFHTKNIKPVKNQPLDFAIHHQFVAAHYATQENTKPYAMSSGSSCSCAQIAGVIAIMKQVFPTISAHSIISYLQNEEMGAQKITDDDSGVVTYIPSLSNLH